MVEVYQFDYIQPIRVAVLEVLLAGLNAFLLAVVLGDLMMLKHLVLSALMDTSFDFYDYLEYANRMAFYPYDCQDVHNILNQICIGHPL